MKKKILIISVVVLAICMLFAMTNTVKADSAVTEVNDEIGLKNALQSSETAKTIKLTADITTTDKINIENISNGITIDGQNHTITLNKGDKTVWGGNYVLQAFKSNVTIKNIKLTGGNAGLLINGSNVTLEGTIDVSGNGFGGIELTKGKNVTTEPTVTFSNAKIVNTTEKYKVPTMWTDSLTTEPTVSYSFTKMNVKKSENNTQTQYYLNGIVVENEADLKDALENTTISEIKLGKDITTTDKINVTRDVTIDGQQHTITLNKGDKTVWDGKYVLQAYKSNVTIKYVKLTGGNAGLLVNGANVTVIGVLDVSGNGFGGIELSKGTGVTENPTLELRMAKLENSTEGYNLPTIWEDPSFNEDAAVHYIFGGKRYVNVGDKTQKQYYLDYDNSVPTPNQQLAEKLEGQINSEENIYLYGDTDDTISKDLLNQLKGKDVDVEIYVSNGVEILFNGKDIEKEFTSDLKLNVAVTEKQPFVSDVLKDDDTDKLFIDLDYSGVLPKGTKILFTTYNVYNEGDKVSLYYYNPETDKVELISDAVNIEVYRDEEYPQYNSELVTISLDHASTYFLSKAKVETPETPVQENEELDETPKTGVVSYTAIVTGVVLASVAGVIALRKRA